MLWLQIPTYRCIDVSEAKPLNACVCMLLLVIQVLYVPDSYSTVLANDMQKACTNIRFWNRCYSMQKCTLPSIYYGILPLSKDELEHAATPCEATPLSLSPSLPLHPPMNLWAACDFNTLLTCMSTSHACFTSTGRRRGEQQQGRQSTEGLCCDIHPHTSWWVT